MICVETFLNVGNVAWEGEKLTTSERNFAVQVVSDIDMDSVKDLLLGSTEGAEIVCIVVYTLF